MTSSLCAVVLWKTLAAASLVVGIVVGEDESAHRSVTSSECNKHLLVAGCCTRTMGAANWSPKNSLRVEEFDAATIVSIALRNAKEATSELYTDCAEGAREMDA